MKTLLTILILASICISFHIFAKAGPPIPVPKISATEAIELAQKYFLENETRNIDGNYFQKKDYIVSLVQYTDSFMEKDPKEWAWKVVFVHPVQNDHSVAYKVTNNEVTFLYATE